MNLHDWIDELCDVLDIEVEVDEALVLDLARDAAHHVVRPAAPISTFLLGYAAAASGGDPVELERLAGLASELALRWDQPADGPTGNGTDDDAAGDGAEGDAAQGDAEVGAADDDVEVEPAE